MIKHLIVFFTLLSVISAFGQKIKQGQVSSKKSGAAIPRAHIQNISEGKYTVSNDRGSFKLPVALGDSILISCIGYKTTGFVIQEKWANAELIEFTLEEDSVFLEEITIMELPSEDVFKRRILDYKPKDTSLQIFGLPPVPDAKSLAYNAVPSISGGSPFGALYRKLSKSEKEKVKYQEIIEDQRKVDQYRKKISRDYIEKLTDLRGEQLTSFIAFCDFKIEQVLQMSDYQLAEVILGKLEDFKKNNQS